MIRPRANLVANLPRDDIVVASSFGLKPFARLVSRRPLTQQGTLLADLVNMPSTFVELATARVIALMTKAPVAGDGPCGGLGPRLATQRQGSSGDEHVRQRTVWVDASNIREDSQCKVSRRFSRQLRARGVRFVIDDSCVELLSVQQRVHISMELYMQVPRVANTANCRHELNCRI